MKFSVFFYDILNCPVLEYHVNLLQLVTQVVKEEGKFAISKVGYPCTLSLGNFLLMPKVSNSGSCYINIKQLRYFLK